MVGCVLCWVLLRHGGIPLRGNREKLLWLRGALGFIALSSTFYSLAHLPLADAIVLFYVYPSFTAVLSHIVHKESFNRRQATGLVCSFGGAVCIARPEFLFGAGVGLDPLAVAAGLCGAFFTAMTMVLIRELGRTEQPLVIILYLCLIALPVSLLASVPVWIPLNILDIVILAGIGILTQCGQYSFARGMFLEPAGRGASAGYLQILFSAFWGWLFLNEVPGPMFAAGTACILCGAFFSTSRPRK